MMRMNRPNVHRPHGDGRQAPVERGLGRQVERPVAQVRVGVGVEDDGQVPVVDHRPVGMVHGQAGPAAVEVADPGVEPGVHEQRVPGVALEPRAPLDLLDHRGVEPDAGVEQEVAAVDRAQPDPADRPPRQRVEQHAGGLDRVVGQSDRAGEHVGRPARQGREGAAGPGQPVGRLVERAVSAEHHDHVDARRGRALGEPGGVAPPAGLGQGHVVVGRQRLADDHTAAGRHRRGVGVHQEDDLHSGPQRSGVRTGGRDAVGHRRCGYRAVTCAAGRFGLPAG